MLPKPESRERKRSELSLPYVKYEPHGEVDPFHFEMRMIISTGMSTRDKNIQKSKRFLEE
ncbi:CLUMA_CG015576, isoform A [Clunio marinus]|uniref:CLUMA_CG015576, isoform A n=1 Tax=Clunio marinus TaxID=568069 RepID=A0A1J1IRG5_9DIPT|nr:CLUMA_CG015576, isoform A [Clunio marinus]